MTALDRTSPLPLYHQLMQEIQARLKAGEFKPGTPLPTELQLIDQYSVSRITVRRAMSELEQSGQIYRVSGKGTFIQDGPMFSPELTHLTSFTEDLKGQAHLATTELLALRRQPAYDEVAGHLEVEEGTEILYIERLRLSEQSPIALNLSYLRIPSSISITARELAPTGSLWALLEGKGIVLHDARRTIQAIAADEDLAQKLQVNLGAPLLLLEGVVRDQFNTPVEYHLVFNRGDRYKHTLYLER